MFGEPLNTEVPLPTQGKPTEGWFRRLVRLVIELRDLVNDGKHKKLILPGVNQTVTNLSVIRTDAVVVKLTAAAAMAFDTTPTIADGDDGQMLCLINMTANTIEIKDEGSLAGSNVRLEGVTVLGLRDVLWLRFDSELQCWQQASKVVSVL